MTPVDVSLSAAPETVEVIGALSDDLGTDWTLIGGLMVGVHLAANDRQPIRLTKDVDLLIDARAVVAPPRLEQAASTLDHVEDQERDVAVLLTLVDDPVAMRAEIDDQGRGPRRKDLRRLRGCQPLMSRDHRGWRGIAAHDQDVGRAVLQVLLNL